MKISKIFDEHAEKCSGQLKGFTLELEHYIHVELSCDQCERRYVAEVYNLEEV